MDTLAKKALKEIYSERDRLTREGKSTHALLGDPVVMHLPRRNLRQKLQKILSSPSRSQLFLNLLTTLMGRIKVLAYLKVIYTFPAEITKLKNQVAALEFQLADQKIELLRLTKTLNKQ